MCTCAGSRASTGEKNSSHPSAPTSTVEPATSSSWRRARLRRARDRSANRATELVDTTGGVTGPEYRRAPPALYVVTARPNGAGSSCGTVGVGAVTGLPREPACRSARAWPARGSVAPAGTRRRRVRSRRGAVRRGAVGRPGAGLRGPAGRDGLMRPVVRRRRAPRARRRPAGSRRPRPTVSTRSPGRAAAATARAASNRSGTNDALPGVGTLSTISAPVTDGSGSSRAA